jgi:transcriptional regulator with XRE-family HTH domain
MFMFYNKFVQLCQRDGISPSKAASLIGFNRSSVSMWKAQGYTPRREILVKIANYFNVSVDYLLGEEDKEKKTTDNDGLSEEEKALLDLFNRVPADSRPMILEMIRAAVNTL